MLYYFVPVSQMDRAIPLFLADQCLLVVQDLHIYRPRHLCQVLLLDRLNLAPQEDQGNQEVLHDLLVLQDHLFHDYQMVLVAHFYLLHLLDPKGLFHPITHIKQ